MILFLSWMAVIAGGLLILIAIGFTIRGSLLCYRGKVGIGSSDKNAGFVLFVVGALVGIAGLGGIL